MLAYAAYLALDERALVLPMGGDAGVRLARTPMEFMSPYALQFDGADEVHDDPIDDSEGESELATNVEFLESDEGDESEDEAADE
jgi:hypothetical protein